MMCLLLFNPVNPEVLYEILTVSQFSAGENQRTEEALGKRFHYNNYNPLLLAFMVFLSNYIPRKGSIQRMQKRTTKHNHASPEPLPASIPNFLKSVNSGMITIHIENEPVLRLTITQSDSDRIKLEFGQKLVEKALVIGLNRLFHTD